MATQKKVIKKSKRRSATNKGQSMLKKKMGKTQKTKKTTGKTNSGRRRSTAKGAQARHKVPEIQDSGAVKEARSSAENIVEDAKKTVEETTASTS